MGKTNEEIEQATYEYLYKNKITRFVQRYANKKCAKIINKLAEKGGGGFYI